jgi:uncharacterized SAM-binding protein YcdF (DUF218 family)
VRAFRILILAALVLWTVGESGRFLVVDDPQKADAILVLAGETGHRPARALELLQRGYARRVILDVPENERVFGADGVQLAQAWIHAQPQAAALSICPITALSTKTESFESAACLRREGVHSVLIVTSDFHTRRARSVYRKEQPEFAFSVAASQDSSQFGERWWQHRQWAKTNLDEWFRLIWWECVDRWY